MKKRLHDLVHARSGDKGNRLNVAVFCESDELYSALREILTEDFVKAVFSERSPKCVTRYELPKLHSFNFVIDEVLEGGVNSSLGLDGHGKTLSYLLLGASIDMTQELQDYVERRASVW